MQQLIIDMQQQRQQLQLQQQAPPLAPQQRLICNQCFLGSDFFSCVEATGAVFSEDKRK